MNLLCLPSINFDTDVITRVEIKGMEAYDMCYSVRTLVKHVEDVKLMRLKDVLYSFADMSRSLSPSDHLLTRSASKGYALSSTKCFHPFL
ncbi:hypothetical protein F2Q69_00031828 [Brassica cretica]|uniref:Uncharacterized protein n=1 Tax=Brassica cretica TaxID=69181 RepID=A0A8S9RSM7_BRACR|nr:hypothetical protein F2Q69_00031828 [Brassica cretica]